MSTIAEFLGALPLLTIILVLFGIYALVTAVFLIMENRSPQSTLAWMLLLLLLPIVGIVFYYFFGRGLKPFSKSETLVRQELGGRLTGTLGELDRQQNDIIDRMEAEEPLRYKHKLLQLVRQNANSMLTAYNRLEILQNASQKYPRLLADIEAAAICIHMEYYSWAADPFTEKLKKLLLRKVDEGVEVRILVDTLSYNTLKRRYVRELRAGGVEIYPFLDFRSPLTIHTISYRNHRKIAVIDGRIAYLGGMNIGQEHIDGGKHFPGWRDTQIRIEGEGALVLQAMFVTSWYNTKQEALSAGSYFPTRASVEEERLYGYLPLQITASGPDSQWAAIKQLYFAMITAAEERIYIQSPFFIPDDSLRDALKAAALSGVEIKLMCAPRGTTYSLPYWAANTYFAEMAEAGVEVFLYEGDYFHPKTISIDSEVCCIGTANMDIRSFNISYEANAVIYDRSVTKKLEADFEADLAHCRPFKLEPYQNRSPFIHLRDSLSRLASPLL